MGPSIAIAMGLAKIISQDKVVLLPLCPTLLSHYIVTHNELIVGFNLLSSMLSFTQFLYSQT